MAEFLDLRDSESMKKHERKERLTRESTDGQDISTERWNEADKSLQSKRRNNRILVLAAVLGAFSMVYPIIIFMQNMSVHEVLRNIAAVAIATAIGVSAVYFATHTAIIKLKKQP